MDNLILSIRLKTSKVNTNLLLLWMLVVLVCACSQDNYSLVSRKWHDLNARDNAYFLAREKMKDVDAQIWKANIDNYNKVLKVYPTLEKTTQAAISGNIEDIIKKAALPVTRHKNSVWVDDSYNLIGKARLYQNEINLAQETFKFVNYKSDDPNARHEALNGLMRTFIVNREYENANAVFTFLKKEKMNKTNECEFYLLRAYYYTMLEEYNKAEPYLALAVPLIKKKDYKARVHFIIAQINQMMNRNTEAYTNYHMTIKKNPPYELTFYAKLYRNQVANIGQAEAVIKVEKYFKQLLNDRKNIEYKDKIYYEMGEFELKRGNAQKAVSYYESSLKEKSKNTYQKATTYYKLARVFYDTLQNYEKAKIYYDSTAQVWDRLDKDYKQIVARQKILEEFVKHLKVVRNEDSLQRLSRMDSMALDKFLGNLIDEEERKKKEEEKLQKEAKEKAERIAFNQKNNPGAMGANQPNVLADPTEQAKWYFYNPTLVISGKQEFTKKWGNRPLEDNWRRATKERQDNFNMSADTTQEIAKNTKPEKIKEKTSEELRKEKIEVYKKDIPFSEEMLLASNTKLENGLYNLGRIYYQKLQEIPNAEKTYIRHTDEFPKSGNDVEVLYNLYLIYEGLENAEKSDAVREKILNQYPKSVYAKLILNPDYLNESKIANKQAAMMYKKAYGMFKDGNYFAADSVAKLTNKLYPESEIQDRLVFLSILVTGKTKNELVYKTELENFIKTFNTSKIIEAAKNNLQKTEAYIAEKNKKGGIADSNAIRYSQSLEQEHFAIITFPKNINAANLAKQLKSFNFKNFANKKLEIEGTSLNDSTQLIIIKKFTDKNAAKFYIISAKDDKSLEAGYSDFDKAILIISKTNLALLKRSRYITDYKRFYLDNYQ